MTGNLFYFLVGSLYFVTPVLKNIKTANLPQLRKPLKFSLYIIIVQIMYFLVFWDHWAHSVSVCK